MADRGGAKGWSRGAWRRLAAAGPVPWVVAALLVGASTVATVVLAPHASDALPDTSRGRIADLLANGGADLVTDTDHDGLADSLENYAYGSDPQVWNSSASPIPDGWLAEWGYDPMEPGVASGRMASPPADRLPAAYRGVWPDAFSPTLLEVYRFQRPGNWSEPEQGPFKNGLDPKQWDANHDGLPDGWLVANGVDPRTPDLSARRLAGPDGLTVRQAFENRTNPASLDSDRDGLPDTAELAGRGAWDGHPITFPRSDPSAYSTSGTGVCDGYLAGHGLDPTSPRAALDDQDHDGASTRAEFNWSLETGLDPCRSARGLDPQRQSTGPSGIPDGWFLRYGLDPLDGGVAERSTGEAVAAPGLPALTLRVKDEYAVNRPPAWSEAKDGPWMGGSDPTKADSDGDGLPDADEVRGWFVNATRVPGGGAPSVARVSSDPTKADADGDGLDDGAERGNRTHPQQRDTDFDGLADGDEIALDRLLAGPDAPANRTRLDPAKSDSVGDLLRDGDRLAVLQAVQALIANGDPYPYAGGAGPRTFEEVARLHEGAADLPAPAPPDALADLFGPSGDLDGDAQPNLLDADLDGDGVPNGAEHDPDLYDASGFPPSPVPRRATDPANADTDGDQLLDGWEVRNGVPDVTAGVNDPDPALYDSDDDGIDDGHEDPDHDSMRTVDFATGSPQVVEYVHDNRAEQQYGTKPHVFDSDGDGLADGWKVYWSLVYGGPRQLPLAPTPGTKQANVTVLPDLVAPRFTTTPLDRAPYETVVGAPVAVHPAGGGAYTVQEVDARIRWTFRSVQENGTNPFLPDTDGDGVDDPWEVWQASLHRRPAADAAAGCFEAAGQLDPLQDDGDLDPDQDGLSTAEEFAAGAGSDPLCRDSDLGSLPDAAEVAAGFDPLNPGDDLGGANPNEDSDHDGRSNLDEVTAVPPTDPTNPDTDGDGLLDGATLGLDAPVTDTALSARFVNLGIAYQKVSGGYRFLGEQGYSDPAEPDANGDGVPDGWDLAHGGTPRADWAACYSYGLPLWWTTASHGPWWGGAVPDANHSCAELTQDPDKDKDGLRDASGEDPIPVANHANTFPAGSPFAAGLSAEQVRLRAQAVVDPRTETAFYIQRQDWTGAPVVPQASSLTLDATNPSNFIRGQATNVTGRLVDGSGNGIVGATILAHLTGATGDDYGAAFTGPGGAFRLPVELTATHAVPLSPGQVLRSQTDGTAAWQTPVDGLAPGARTLTVVSYATPERTGVPAHAAAQAAPRAITIQHKTLLSVEAPQTARPGSPISVLVRETDKAGLPRSDPITVSWPGLEGSPPKEVGSDGTLRLSLIAPMEPGLIRLELATIAPTNVIPGSATATIGIQELATIEMDPLPRTDAGQSIVAAGRVHSSNLDPFETVSLRLTTPASATLATQNASVDGSGRFQAAFTIPPAAPPGTYVLVAALPASQQHSDGAGSATVKVRGRTALSEPSLPALKSSGNRTIDARLVDAAGHTVAGRLVALDLGGEHLEERSDDNGLARFTFTKVLPSGPHREVLRFAGDDSYAPSSLQRERTVQGPTRLALAAGNGTPGGSVPARVTLTDEAGAPLAGRPVRASLEDGSTVAGLTGADGVAALALPVRAGAPLGPVAVAAKFAGDGAGSFAPSEARGLARILLGSTFEAPSAPVVLGSGVPTARLLDERGRPLAHANVTILDASGVATVRRTGDDGAFPLLEEDALPTGPDDVKVLLRYAGDSGHPAAAAETTLRFRLPGSLGADVPAVVAGETAVLHVVAADGSGQLLREGAVTATLGGVAVTRPLFLGEAYLPIPVPDSLRGDQPLRITLEHATYEAPPIERTVPVVARTLLEATLSRAGDGVRLHLKAVAGGAPAAHVPLAVFAAGLPAGFTVETDEDGEATVDLAQPGAATGVFVRYAGGPGASPATLASVLTPAQVAALGAAAPASGLWVLGATGAACLLVVAVALAVRRRRHPLLRALLSAQRVLQARGPYDGDILACYATLQDHLVAAGILAGPAPTPRLLADALAKAVPLGPAEEALGTLIAVFERARYGARAVGPLDRDLARDSLRRLRRGLLRAGLPSAPAEVPA